MEGLLGLAGIGAIVWVGVDSSRLGMRRGGLGGGLTDMGTVGWVLSCMILWIVALPLYFVARSRYLAINRAYGAPTIASNPVFGQMYGEPILQQAPPQYSPDGQWWWTGSEWVPVQR